MYIIYDATTGSFLSRDGVTWCKRPLGAWPFQNRADAERVIKDFYDEPKPYKFWVMKLGGMIR